MSIRLLFFSLFAGALSNSSVCAETGASLPMKGSRPNVVFFLADDQSRFNHTAYGHPTIPTITTDALAEESLVFDRAFTGQAICAPSRSMLYTGLYPIRNGCFLNHYKIRPGVKTLPAYLNDLGYTVILAGKSHVKPGNQFKWSESFPPVKKAGASRDWIPLDQIDAFLAHPGPNPFCLIVASEFPHGPFMTETPYQPEDVVLEPFEARTDENLLAATKYYASVAQKEAELAALLKLIDKHGQRENSLVFYSDDHGLSRGKYTSYDSGLNIAFMVRWPDRIKPGRTEALVSFADFVPTVIELAGGDAPSNLDGMSLLRLLRGESTKHHTHVYGVTTNQGTLQRHVFPQRSVRDERYHYIHSFNTLDRIRRDRNAGKEIGFFHQRGANKHGDIPEELLFDTQNDPHEMKNLANAPSYQTIKQRLEDSLFEWMRQQNDLLNKTDPVPLLKTAPSFALDRADQRNRIPKQQVGSLKGKLIDPHEATRQNEKRFPEPKICKAPPSA
ncbi:Choline-sulfatase [Pirellulimonas nuda]|uniref:Choline-sulfatase n=1 Tax=Pirellulimonas nuda TaxID=2528009 RepID=A0A518DAD6_9BACT|nr:sulfatase [Pirellulimonas nuda]QDU88418.1 Choline-sulfatase [Pirellulimonas nuda]